MIDFYNEKLKLEELTAEVKTSEEALNLPQLKVELIELRKKQEEDGFWLDVEKAKRVNQRIAEIERKEQTVEALKATCQNVRELMDMAEMME